MLLLCKSNFEEVKNRYHKEVFYIANTIDIIPDQKNLKN